MSRLVWDRTGEHLYETGVQHGVLYPYDKSATADKVYGPGVVWNGLSSVSETPSGGDENKIYADNIKYLSLRGLEEFGGTIEAYTYPDEWAECDGSATPVTGLSIGQQARKMFGFCFRTEVGNDVKGDAYGYKLHLIYGCTASPSERSYETINDSPEAITFSWEISTTSVAVGTINNVEYRPTSSLIIDASKLISDQGVKDAKLVALENALYGVDAEKFSTTKAYAKGDYCTHTESTVTKTYQAKNAITAGSWDATKWDEVDAGPYLPSPAAVVAMLSAS